MENYFTGIIKLMLQAGAHVIRQDRGGDTPLHDAAKNNLNKVVQTLSDQGVDQNLKKRHNSMHLMWRICVRETIMKE